LSSWLADDSRFWTACACLFAAISILKGLRIPGLWAATQGYLNYQDGFIKRGLFGAVMQALHVQIAHYDVFVSVSGVILVVFLGVLTLWIVRSGAREVGSGSFVALFAASYCLTFLTHLIGYLDILSAGLAMVVLLTSRSRLYLPVVFGMAVLGILIHENYLLTFLPLTLLPAILRAFDSGPRKREIAAILAVVVAVAVIVLLEALTAPMSAEHLARLQTQISAAVDFPPRDDVLTVLGRSALDNVAIMLQQMKNGLWWLAQLNALLVFMPTTALFVWASLTMIDAQSPQSHPRAIKAIVTLTALCPLSLQFVGWDIYRWYTFAAFSSFIVMTIVYRHFGARLYAPLVSNATRNLLIVLIAVNMATGSGLFDGYRVDTFPFIEHWRGLAQWLAGGRHWLAPPL
jgi:hypothetical protein